MIGLAFTLLIIAAVAAILGFSGLAGALANVAIIIFVVALIAAVVLFVLGKKAVKSVIDCGSTPLSSRHRASRFGVPEPVGLCSTP